MYIHIFTRGLYYHFNSLRFRADNINYFPIPISSVFLCFKCFHLKYRLLKCSLAHPMSIVRNPDAEMSGVDLTQTRVIDYRMSLRVLRQDGPVHVSRT